MGRSLRTTTIRKDLEVDKMENNNGIFETKLFGIDYDYTDTDNYTLETVKTSYNSTHIVNVDDELIKLSDRLTGDFKAQLEAYGIEATENQLYYINEFARCVFGTAKDDNKITLIPAPCGYGKSVGKYIILNHIQDQIKAGSTNGAVVVGDRLDDLKELQNKLGSQYAYLMEGWNEDICKDGTRFESSYKMCANCKCSSCKVKTQSKKQTKYPILLMTNARLNELGEGVNKFQEWDGGVRTLLFIDERPVITNNVLINKTLLNKIDSFLNNEVDYKGNNDDKTKLCDMFAQISEKAYDFMRRNRSNYKRKRISLINREPLTDNDNLFYELWETYVGKYDYKKELEAIEAVIRSGGIYINEGKAELICKPTSKDLKNNYGRYKTFILDGSSLYDPQYNTIMDYSKFLYVPNTRTFENLTFNIYESHKINKSKFKYDKNLCDKISNFLESLPDDGSLYYIITYMEQAPKIKINNEGKFILDSIKVPNMKEGIIEERKQVWHFGATKGKNSMSSCDKMIQFGYNVKPDYITALEYLSTLPKCDEIVGSDDFDEVLQDSMTKTWRYIDDNSIIPDDKVNSVKPYDKYFRYGSKSLNEYEWLGIVCELYQEIFRTALRNYSCNEPVEITLFKTEPIIIKMLETLFPKCTVNYIYDKIPEFEEVKTMTRKTKDGKPNNVQKVNKYLKEHNEVIIKNMLDELRLTKDQWKNVKKNNSVKNELDMFEEVREGNIRILKRIKILK